MVSIENQLDDLIGDITKLDSAIKNLEITKTKLKNLQTKLDSFELKTDNLGYSVSPLHYSRLLELQSLIHYASGDIIKSREFVESAKKYLPEGEVLVSDISAGMFTVEHLMSPSNSSDLAIPNYMTVSTTRLVLLGILTGGIYSTYWAYKNFKAVKAHLRSKGDNTTVLPFLSAIFLGLTSYSLFVSVRESHKNLGLDSDRVKAGKYAWGFFFLNQILLGFTMLIGMQRHMNIAKQAAFGDTLVRKGTSVGEVLWVIFGAMYIWGSFISAFSESAATYSSEVSNKRISVDMLTSLYETCSESLGTREKTLDLYDASAVDIYNKDQAECESTRLKQNSAVDEYNRLIGQ